jgi:nitric oxide reductase NorD protein
MDYLPHMYGPANFTVVSQLHQLPHRVSDIYRRITV